MRKELEQRLVEHWPTWFNPWGDIRQTLMPRGFSHDSRLIDVIVRDSPRSFGKPLREQGAVVVFEAVPPIQVDRWISSVHFQMQHLRSTLAGNLHCEVQCL